MSEHVNEQHKIVLESQDLKAYQQKVDGEWVVSDEIAGKVIGSMIDEVLSELSVPKEGLYYHVAEHSIRVMNRVEAILNEYLKLQVTHGVPVNERITPRKITIAKLIALYHDYVQKAFWGAKVTRKPSSGVNEAESAMQCITRAKAVNARAQELGDGVKVFTDKELHDAWEGIEATEAVFLNDGGIAQPNLKKRLPLIQRVHALADLNGVGWHSEAERSLEEVGQLFREMNPWVQKHVDVLNTTGRIKKEAWDKIREAILQSYDRQYDFLQDRREQFPKDLEGMESLAQQAVRRFITEEGFKEYGRAIDNKIKEIRETDTLTLLEDIGYAIPQSVIVEP